MRWILDLLREAPPPAPVLLRIADEAGAPATEVELEVTWHPSGTSGARRHRTASGLCVIPWMREEKRAVVTVRSERGETQLEIARDRPDSGRVRDVSLRRALSRSA